MKRKQTRPLRAVVSIPCYDVWDINDTKPLRTLGHCNNDIHVREESSGAYIMTLKLFGCMCMLAQHFSVES
ncbi:hypothetical protein Pelo_13767 [Pelomyxa schiedti]|nr:hypothetical protein Pelo_13767 [Pelomyxa schiedti]